MAAERVGGIIFLKLDGQLYKAKGSFSYNIGVPKREGIVGHDQVHGYKETPQISFIEGTITDSSQISLEALLGAVGITATLELANGKVIALRDAWFAADGTVTTEEGEIEARFEGMDGEEIR